MVLIFKFRGLMAPAFTPYSPDDCFKLNLDIIPRYANLLNGMGVKAVLINGTTGEHTMLSTKERMDITESWAAAVKETGQTLMVQVGGASLPDVIKMARHAESLQVAGILCLPELFFKPSTADALVKYLEVICKAAPITPLFYYHFPAITGVNIPMPEFMELAEAKIFTFSGIKFTSNDLDEGAKCVRVNEDLAVFLGADTIYSGAVSLGFDSAILTTLNFWPKRFEAILTCLREGRQAEALAIQNNISSNVEQILSGGSWVEKMKLHMVRAHNFDVGNARPALIN